MNRFYVFFEGNELGTIRADTWEEARNRVEEVITIEEDADNEYKEVDELKEIVTEKIKRIKRK